MTKPRDLSKLGGGFIQSGTGAVQRTVESKLKDAVSVKDFGAVGDGVTDAKSSFEAAASASKLFQVPRGTYAFSSNVDMGNAVYEGLGEVLFTGAGTATASGLTFSSGVKSGKTFSNTSISATSIYNSIYPGIRSFDVVQSILEVPPDTTIDHLAVISAYGVNKTPTSGISRNTVLLFGCGKSTVNNAALWGINTLLQDADTRTAGSDTGRVLIGAELDFNVMNPATEVIGMSLGGNSLAQPTVASGYLCNTLGNGNKWTTAFASLDGCATNGFAAGALSASGSNIKSQPMLLSSFNGSGVKVVTVLQTAGDGTLELAGPSGTRDFSIVSGNLKLTGNTAIQFAGSNVLFADPSSNCILGSASKITTIAGAYTLVDTLLRFTYDASGAGSATLGSNCPAVTPGAPYTWLQLQTLDGSTVYIPCWK